MGGWKSPRSRIFPPGDGARSSSAFCVGLLHALQVYSRSFVSAKTLAEQSCHVEIDICQAPIGKQDQYASAFGGLNFIQFNPDESVLVEPIICLKETIEHMQRNCLYFLRERRDRLRDCSGARTRPFGRARRPERLLKKWSLWLTSSKTTYGAISWILWATSSTRAGC